MDTPPPPMPPQPPAPAPVPPPAAPSQYAYPPPVTPGAPEPAPTGQGTGFLKGIDIVATCFFILGSVAILLVINYYRDRAKADRKKDATVKLVSDEVTEIKSQFAGIKERLRMK